MPSHLLDRDFVTEFETQIAGTRKLQVASAWMTDSRALRALLRRGKKRCKVQAIIGTHGYATTPASLSDLADEFDEANVRLADTDRLFHPKLVLFHRWNGTVAWIGSANFTSGGMDGNTELVLQTDDDDTVHEMEEWFGRQWNTLNGQDFRKELADYEPKWAKAQRNRKQDALRDLVSGSGSDRVEPPVHGDGRPTTIRIRPRARPKGNGPLPGTITYGEGETASYKSAADGLRQLLRWLSTGREDAFFTSCSGLPAFNKVGKPLVAKARSKKEARDKVYVRRGSTGMTVTVLVDNGRSAWRWYISEDSGSKEKWDMAKAAIEVANEMAGKPQLALADQSLASWPDKLSRSRRP